MTRLLLICTASLAFACGHNDVTGETGTSQTETGDGSCIPAEPGCECNGGLCLTGLECVDNICVSPECIPGDVGCECNDGLSHRPRVRRGDLYGAHRGR